MDGISRATPGARRCAFIVPPTAHARLVALASAAQANLVGDEIQKPRAPTWP